MSDNKLLQSGDVTPGHATVWTTDGIVEDGGTSFEGALTSLGITSAGDTSFAINDAPVTGPYSAFSLGINNTSNALVSVDSFDGAPQLGLYFRINGHLSSFHLNPDGTPSFTPDDGLLILNDVLVTGKSGFNGAAPIAQPTITGSKGGNAALASLLTALASYGLVTDSTT